MLPDTKDAKDLLTNAKDTKDILADSLGLRPWRWEVLTDASSKEKEGVLREISLCVSTGFQPGSQNPRDNCLIPMIFQPARVDLVDPSRPPVPPARSPHRFFIFLD